MNINNKFKFGDIVYKKVNTETPGMVTGFLVRPNTLVYIVSWDDGDEKYHYDIELTDEKSFRTGD